MFFAACGVTELCISFLICTPWNDSGHSPPGPSAIRLRPTLSMHFSSVSFYFHSSPILNTTGCVKALMACRAHSLAPLPLPGLMPVLAFWPPIAFFVNFAILDFADYCRHRISHRVGWWYGIHSLHHAEEQMTFWSDDRSHVLEDAITYLWLITVGLLIGVPSFQFPFSHTVLPASGQYVDANTRIGTAGSASIYSSRRSSIAHIMHLKSLPDDASCNFGTTLVWWDMLFGTGRFGDHPW